MSERDDLQAEINRLRAENAALRVRSTSLTLRISEKKALSVFGMGRFPVTLYRDQWIKLLGLADQIRSFIEENREHLIDKPKT